MKLSVIVPVYNAEKYLNSTIENILKQTFTDFELILIDDGSTDSSGQLCDKWSQKDGRIKVIYQKNMGVSEARNSGLRIAQGEYIAFVDNDDLINPQMYEILISIAEKESADIVMSKECEVYEDNIIFEKYSIPNIVYEIVNQEAMFMQLFSYGKRAFPYIHIWNKIYKRQAINECYFSLESMEDSFFNCNAYALSKKNIVISENIHLYFWIIRNDSFSHDMSSGHQLMSIKAYHQIVNEVQRVAPELSHYAIEKAMRTILSVRYSFTFTQRKREVKKEAQLYYGKLKPQFYSNKRIKKSHKMIIQLFYYFPFSFRAFMIINDPTMIKWERMQKKELRNKDN